MGDGIVRGFILYGVGMLYVRERVGDIGLFYGELDLLRLIWGNIGKYNSYRKFSSLDKN